MLVAFVVIGGIGTPGANPSTAAQYVIVIFSYFVIIGYNYGIGPLAYTIARETAGRSTTEISRFFTEHVPVRQWKTHVFESLYDNEHDMEKKGNSTIHETGLSDHVDQKV